MLLSYFAISYRANFPLDFISYSFSIYITSYITQLNVSFIYYKIQLTIELETLVKGKTKFYNLKDPQRKILYKN